MISSRTLNAREGIGAVGGVLMLAICGKLLWLKCHKRRKKEIIVFSRYPLPGQTKTRLIPVLGEKGAASLQRCMTEHIIRGLNTEKLGQSGDLDICLQYHGGSSQQMSYWVERPSKGMNLKLRPQAGSDLGDKLTQAVKESFALGHEFVVVIGSDIPGINADILTEAFDTLQTGCDMVLGRAEDGGYYLVGFNKNNADKFIDDIFRGDINWGTSTVFQQQTQKAEKLGVKLKVLSRILNDVDTIEDLAVFESETGITLQHIKSPQWSVVVPVLNEGNNIQKTLTNVIEKCSNSSVIVDIVVSDGGSTDNTIEKIQQFSESSQIPVKLVHSEPGRGNQLNTGARAAKGDNFIFLHADSLLPSNYDIHATECLAVPGNVAGAFKFGLDILEDPQLQRNFSSFFLWKMRMLVWGTHKRATAQELPYGDQGLFLSRRTFNDLGGFPPYYLMEDYIMVEKLRKVGHVAIASGYPIITSARRWIKWGWIRITGMNTFIICAYKLGVHPDTLARWYYGDKLKKK